LTETPKIGGAPEITVKMAPLKVAELKLPELSKVKTMLWSVTEA
jgi:hypothetical protein